MMKAWYEKGWRPSDAGGWDRVPTATSFGREIVQGIMRYANSRRRWALLEDFEGKINRPSGWPPCDGFIVTRHFDKWLNHFAAAGPPIVCCSGAAIDYQVPVVCTDDAAIARLSAEHLLDCRLEHFAAYCPRGLTLPLASRRLGAFQKVLEEKKHALLNLYSGRRVDSH